VRRANRLSKIAAHTELPPEALLDLALELLETLERRLPPETQVPVGLATERWRRSSAQDRSAALRRVARARWHRR
jgi:hypothetical protein